MMKKAIFYNGLGISSSQHKEVELLAVNSIMLYSSTFFES
jgi:hypothetical protein